MILKQLLAVFQRPIAEQKILAIHITNLLLKHHKGLIKATIFRKI